MERRAARREPRNADYDALFELSRTATLEVDAAGVVLRANPAAMQLLDISPEDLRVRTLDELLGVDVTAALASNAPTPLVTSATNGAQQVVLHTMRRDLQAVDGERFTIQVTPVPDEDERRPADDGSTVVPRYAGGLINHDLGTPLSIVRGYAETLATHLDQMSRDAVAEAVGTIHRHASRAVDELEALRARARLDTGEAGTVPVSVLVAWLRRMLDADLAAANAALVSDLQVDQVTLDVAVARQALLNMCRIALCCDPPPRAVVLEVSSVERGASIVLRHEGRDGGDGPTTMDELASFTIDATTSLVTDHGGTYEPPTRDDPTQRLVLPPTAHREPGGAAPGIPVVIIEDEPSTAALIEVSLRSSTMLFDVAASERTFAAGLAAVARVEPRIVLLDQHLPDGIGTDGLDELRAAAPGTRIVVLSARRQHEEDSEDVTWLEKGRVLADVGQELIAVLATGDPEQGADE